MTTAAAIKNALSSALDDPNTQIEVCDDSHLHAGHREAPVGGGSHFSVTVISSSFESLSRVKRHQLIYKALNAAFEQGLHALAITAITPEEWAAKA